MVDVDKAVVSRLKKGKRNFEILVDPVKALDFKMGKSVSIDEILAYPGVYRDVRKGEIASTEELQGSFGTTDIYQIAKKILKEGKMQFTTEQKAKFIEEKRKEIADIISRRGIDPQTNLPHPPQRILNAMKKVGVKIEPFVDADLQVSSVLEAIKPLLPIKFQKIVLRIVIPPQHTGKAYSFFKRSFEKFEEEWLNDGSLQVILDIPVGMQEDLFRKIGEVTKGDFRSEVIRRVDL